MNSIKNQRGFTHVSLVAIVAVVAIIGFAGWRVYVLQSQTSKERDKLGVRTAEQSTDSTTKTQENEPKDNAVKPSERQVPSGYKLFVSKLQGISFFYPDGWSATEGEYDYGYKWIKITSPDLQKQPLDIGAEQITAGVSIVLSVNELNGRSLEQTYNTGLVGQLISNGSSKPKNIKVGNYDAVEFSVQYESPAQTSTYFVLKSGQRYVQGTFSSSDDSHDTTYYKEYIKILASVI